MRPIPSNSGGSADWESDRDWETRIDEEPKEDFGSNDFDNSINIKRSEKLFRQTLSARSRRILARIAKMKSLNSSNSIDLDFALSTVRDSDTTINTVVDSGTSLHIVRDRENFVSISQKQVKLRGVAGTTSALRGVLKPCVLGGGLEAVYYPKLPVRCLLSVEGIKQHSWNSHFTQGRNYIENVRTNEEIEMSKNEKGLPTLELKFYDSVADMEALSFYCSPCDDVVDSVSSEKNTFPVYSNLMRRLKIPGQKKSAIKAASKRSQQHPKTPKGVPKLLQHQRMCHMHTEGESVRCLDCLENKGKRGGAAKVRAEKYERNPLVLFSADFFGKVKPTSIRGNCWVLAFICDVCNLAHVEVLSKKEDAPEALIRFTKLIRSKCGCGPDGKTDVGELIVAGIHTDNEPVLKGHAWKQACSLLKIHELHSIPYVPQTNGLIERWIFTAKDALRTTMCGVDSRVWDWAMEHIALVWNLKVHNKCSKFNDGKPASPNKILADRSSNPFVHESAGKQKYLKRFGCLCFFKPYKSPIEKESERNKVLLPKRLRGIHLGFSKNNSAYLIGTVNSDGKFSTYESRDVTFCEDILVHDVRALAMHKDVGPEPPLLDLLLERCQPLSAEKSEVAGVEKSAVGTVADDQLRGLERTQWEVPEVERDSPLLKEDFGPLKTEAQPEVKKLKENIRGSPAVFDIVDTDPMEVEPHIPPEVGNDDPMRANMPIGDQCKSSSGQHNGVLPAEKVTFGPPAESARKRGRPKGSKDKKPRKRKEKQGKAPAKDEASFFSLLADDDADAEFYSHFVMEDGEELLEAEVFLAKTGEPSKPGDAVKASWAFSDANPEKPRWIEAENLEQTRLLAYQTWRKLSPDEEQDWRSGRLKATPTALILNRKRCGRYKARLVVLGNRWEPTGENNVYASVVSQVGNRTTLVHAAKEGFEVAPFDIGNAFIRASVGDLKIIVNIPAGMQDQDTYDSGRRMLLKALYGLPISPRLWAKTLGEDLRKLGWQECLHEPGVWRKLDADGKVVGYLTVYVDDCVLACKNKVVLKTELDRVHATHPLSLIKCEPTPEGGIKFDLTGADIDFNSSKRTVKISMEAYIVKMLARFDMTNAKPRATPGFEEKNLYDPSSKESSFPYKACVGALQWATTCARPDLAHSVNTLARAGANKCTRAMEKCARIVLRYLVGTKEHYISYSPEIEKKFLDEFKEMAEHEGENDTPQDKNQTREAVHVFADASFGTEFKTMKSVSGVVVYVHGCPIAWRSKVQSVFTSCTTQSEWVAMADAIQFSSTIYGLKNFLYGLSEMIQAEGPIWGDNRGAILNARKGVLNMDELSKVSRHVALRHANVLDESRRIWWVSTDRQRADGLTKSSNRQALDMLTHRPESAPPRCTEDIDEEAFFSMGTISLRI